MRWNLIEGNWKQLIANYINPPDNLLDGRLEMIEIRIDQRTNKTRERHEIAMKGVERELAHWRGMQRIQVSASKK